MTVRPFVVDRAGTPERVWRSHLADVPPWPVPSAAGALVVVAPHPDDECLAVGGLVATLLAQGWSLHVIAVTDGEAAFGPLDATAAAVLGRRRRWEQQEAVECLGGHPGATTAITRLGLPDGDVAACYDELVGGLRRPLEGADLALAPLMWDGHPDHEACGAALVEACPGGTSRAHYPVWAWHWAQPDQFPLERLRRVHLSAWAARRKRRALERFRSQTTAGPGRAPVLPDHVLAHFARPFEVLVG